MRSVFRGLVPAVSRGGTNVDEVNTEVESAPLTEPISLDMSAELRSEFADVYDVCRAATDEVIAGLGPGGYERLGRNSPALRNYDWQGYIDLSMFRLARVARTLKARLAPGSRVLDFGSYFGNASLVARKMGYDVTALDSYSEYAPALVRECSRMSAQGIRVLDSTHSDNILDQLDETFDAVLMLGVIEHIPHSPKAVLEHVIRRLSPGGLLVLDTPNLAYVYNREKLMRGESIFLDIRLQFGSEIPFEGHHREFTFEEVAWMIGDLGLDLIESEIFNYSIYGLSALSGDDLRRWREMGQDETKRELIYVVASKTTCKGSKVTEISVL